MATPIVLREVTDGQPAPLGFAQALRRHGVDLHPLRIETLQVNLTKLCNQACKHCHVDASPSRTEALPREGIERILALLDADPNIGTLDLTGGAPELHPDFDWLVEQARARARKVIVRHNLTVSFDGNPQTGESKAYLPTFFARNGVEVVSSLPCYSEDNTDTQRGKGVFSKSIAALQALNGLGYGMPNSGLTLNLVYNPLGPTLPPPQAKLELDYKKVLGEQFGIRFNQLLTITNMPIHRFALHLRKSGAYQEYMDRLVEAFNPAAAQNVMCRALISVGADGRLYDCDFNQQLELPIERNGEALTLFDFAPEELLQRRIRLANHCFGCTAGAGSSCGGATT